MNFQSTKKLRNGYNIPVVALGTWQSKDGLECEQAVKWAIEEGYRHIDCAAVYHNEKSVGKAIKESQIDRKELFLTSKVWNTERGYEKTMKAFQKTINDLGVDYLDLYLIHWPASPSQFEHWEELNLSTWKAMTELYNQGKIKAIGVSNFMAHHLKALMETEVKPMVNQIEFHPGFMQQETVDYCQKEGIILEAWSPLGTGRVLQNPTLLEVASSVQRTPAQVCLRWALQHDFVILPKSVHHNRIVENTKLFDFELSQEQMNMIDGIEITDIRFKHPDKIDF